uniref:Putative inorganic phosphate cotransporter n=1 Tax=Cuerna arida TaxID=1464854 RepID=A0A1B6F2P7_9HEMI
MEKKKSTVSSASQLIIQTPPSWIGVRHLQVVLLFLCMLFAYIIRVNISVAIVAMTGEKPDVDEYTWDTPTKSLILSAFFWGYLVMNVPAAVIGHSVNNKMLLGGSFACASILSLLTPLLARWGGATMVIIIRVCQGLTQGFMMPMIHGLLSKWAPPHERARFSTYILGGLNFGTMLVLSFSGLLASSPWGWPSIFYFSGGLGLLWVVLWMLLGANSPEAHPFISAAERQFIQRSLPSTARDDVKMAIPWRDILTSGPVWAATLAHIGQNWAMWTILTEIPTYFNKALNYNLSNGGFLTAMPFLLMWLVSFPLSYIADKLIIKGITSVTASRKIWNTVAHWGGAIALIGLAFATDSNMAVVLYTIAVTINCCIYMGFNVNHLDLSPNFARILMGITNGLANVTSIIAPLFVGLVINDETDIGEWRIVFLFSALAYFLGNLAFIILGSGQLQDWNEPNIHHSNNVNSDPKEDDRNSSA